MNTIVKETYLTLSYPALLPDENFSDLLEKFNSNGLALTVKKTKSFGPYASLEWAVPTMIALWITKPFFESFLKEAGKDGYVLVKEALKSILAKGRQNVNNKPTHKESKTYFQTSYVSISVDLKHGKKLKILFDERLTLNDWNMASDALLDKLVSDYDSLESKIICSSTLLDSIGDRTKLYAVISIETKEWEILTDREMIQNQIELSRKINAALDKEN